MRELSDLATTLGGYTPIVDGNVVNLSTYDGKSLSRHLRNYSPDSLVTVNDDLVQRNIDHIDSASRLISSISPHILPEVRKELRALSNSFAKHHDSYKEKLSQSDGEWQDTNESHRVAVENIRKLANRASFFGQQASLYNVKPDWNSPDLKFLVDLARSQSGYMTEKTRKELGGSSIGLSLETDLKLVAYTMHCARSIRTALISADVGVLGLAKRVRNILGDEVLNMGQDYCFHDIATYNLNNHKIFILKGNI